MIWGWRRFCGEDDRGPIERGNPLGRDRSLGGVSLQRGEEGEWDMSHSRAGNP